MEEVVGFGGATEEDEELFIAELELEVVGFGGAAGDDELELEGFIEPAELKLAEDVVGFGGTAEEEEDGFAGPEELELDA